MKDPDQSNLLRKPHLSINENVASISTRRPPPLLTTPRWQLTNQVTTNDHVVAAGKIDRRFPLKILAVEQFAILDVIW